MVGIYFINALRNFIFRVHNIIGVKVQANVFLKTNNVWRLITYTNSEEGLNVVQKDEKIWLNTTVLKNNVVLILNSKRRTLQGLIGDIFLIND